MTKLLLTFLITFSFILGVNGQRSEQTIAQQAGAIELAREWFNLLHEAENMDALVSMSTYPFALDGKDILNSTQELEDFYQEVFKSKGHRSVPEISIEVLSSHYDIIQECIPLNAVIIKITLRSGDLKDDAILVSVAVIGESLKITGFTD